MNTSNVPNVDQLVCRLPLSLPSLTAFSFHVYFIMVLIFQLTSEVIIGQLTDAPVGVFVTCIKMIIFSLFMFLLTYVKMFLSQLHRL